MVSKLLFTIEIKIEDYIWIYLVFSVLLLVYFGYFQCNMLLVIRVTFLPCFLLLVSFDTIYLRALKIQQNSQLGLAHGTETEN